MTSSLGVREEKKPAWTEEEEEELRRLYEEHRHSDGKLELLVCSTVMSFWSYPWSRCVLSWLYSSRCCGNRVDSAQQHRANPAAGGHSARAHGSGGKHQGAEETKVRSPRPGMNKCRDDFPAPWFPLTEVFFYYYLFLRKGTQIILWTEEQEMELEILFEEFKDSDGKWETPQQKRSKENIKIIHMQTIFQPNWEILKYNLPSFCSIIQPWNTISDCWDQFEFHVCWSSSFVLFFCILLKSSLFSFFF